MDTDGDGLADTIDAFPNDGTRTTDTDLDGYDDLIEDDCTDEWVIQQLIYLAALIQW